ncbi:larval cuticle protein 1-like [Contarinia nasturtii]|uniref:larval cuticle protein 1-like n=1 Tax=Contarinia nasturtii TaxID=265458 RepID=UPI0012D40019|nr:larval cuticle protein 1-like [Contarinia nasturtii]
MKKFIAIAVFCVLIACIQSAPQFDQHFQQQPEQQSKYVVADGRFHQDPNLEYNFEQKFVNGEEFREDGKFKTVSGMDVIVTKGSYTIVEKDGSITVVNYTADEHGFHPEVVTSSPAQG